ncbi:cytochrome P450 monooxygenase-like protein [Amylocarpus encephaloides]|uniref:Cytochrome P450 monooxygenase-like protein n=1 Tax=Amylocarpus encephaloides TaxID=45428 RepID=A0A9P7YUP8_9HELO|nr:cytochrome P450 monooxygenase-like protein [Amylocarpus encephaloides]
MFNLLASLALGIFALVSLTLYRKLHINIAKAKRTGLSYVVSPYFGVGIIFFFPNHILTPLFQKLPCSENWAWLRVSHRKLSWTYLRTTEDIYGDTFLIVSPFIVYLKTSSAQLAAQVTSRRNDFVKPIENYKIIGFFGGSILTTEGDEWKRHKRIVAPSFSEKSNRLVFEESLRQAQGMMEYWAHLQDAENDCGDLRVENVATGTKILSLHVICAAGFGVPQLWPNESEDRLKGKGIPGFSGHTAEGGHTMTMKSGLTNLLTNIMWFAAFSPSTLRHIPFPSSQRAYTSYSEVRSYFTKLLDIKKQDLSLGETENGTMDLLGTMVRSSDQIPPDHSRPTLDPKVSMTQSEIIGNSFIMLFAGHETSANSIHFSLIYLATNISAQRRLQSDVDTVVGSKTIEEWDYQIHMPKLYNSMVGAVLNEQMRLIPAIPNIPKVCSGDQIVKLDGREIVIPDGTFTHLNVVGTNRNPRYWKKTTSLVGGKADDMDDFVPERWLPTMTTTPHDSATEEQEQTLPSDGLETTSFLTSTPTSLHRPEKGAFLSFSEGPRACPGRRFAQVEITAVLASIFQKYSVELDVAQWASGEQVSRMGKEEKKRVYGKAVDGARAKLRDCEQMITLQLRPGTSVPLRFVERGREIFGDL